MKRWFKYVLAVITALVVLGFCWEARGQGCPDDYGCVLYYRSDIWPRSDLRAHFVFDPGVQGSFLIEEQDYGDYETWSGPSGGCTDCPTGWGCDCTTFGGDVNSESTYIYQTDTSANITPAGNLTGLIFYARNFAPNEAYQFSFCYLGGTGTEDLTFGVGHAALTESYDWATKTWTAPITWTAFADIGTAWTCANAYLTVGPVAKANYLIILSAGSADGTAIYIDNVEFNRLNAMNITGSRGNVLSVAGDPQWGHSEVLLPRVGTGPAGKSGMKTDGVDDHLFCPDADCEMDPINWASGGSFSIGCRVMPDTVVGTPYIISKYLAAGNQRSWYIQRNAAGLAFVVSDDGVNIDFNTVAMFTTDASHSFVSTFDPSGGSGACENNIYYNAYQIDTDATMTECAPFDSTADLQIGAQTAGSIWTGPMLECSLWERKLSPIEANKFISPHFPATNHGDGFWVDTCSQAASHSTCSTQICRQGTPNECQAEGTGVMACFDQATEIVVDNSWEGIVGDPSAGTWAEWTKTETPGNGSASITAYLADSFHKNASARFTLTGTTSEAELESDCIPVVASTAYYNFIKAKKLYGTTKMYMYVDLYLAADCSGSAAAIGTVVNGVDVPDGIYTEYGGTFSTLAGINSLKIRVISYQSASSFLVDTISLKLGTYRKPWNENPSGAGTTTYTSRQYELHNPLSDFDEATQKYGYEDGFCASAWMYSDWAGDDARTHRILNVPGTAGNNNRWMVTFANTWVGFYVYDSIAGTLTVIYVANATSWTAGDWKYVEACSDNAGTTKMHYLNVNNSTWYDGGVGGAGTGIQNGQSADLHIGHAAGVNYLDGYTPKIHLSPYPSGNFVWPQKGFNNGRPPVNGRPY